MSDSIEERMRELDALVRQVPPGAAKTAREAAQREYDADQRAHEALLARGSQLLAAAGVAVGLLVGLTKESSLDTCRERLFLTLALVAAGVAAVLVVVATFITNTKAATDSSVAFGIGVPNAKTVGEDRWIRLHELRLALHYCQARLGIRERHRARANLIRAAQVCYAAMRCRLTRSPASSIAWPRMAAAAARVSNERLCRWPPGDLVPA